MILGFSACSDTADDRVGELSEARDSAGIRIVEVDPDRAPVWQVGATAEWSFSEVEVEAGGVHALAGVRSVGRYAIMR